MPTSSQNSSCIKTSTITLITPFRVLSKTYNVKHTDGEVTLDYERRFYDSDFFDSGTVQVRADVMGGDGYADNYITTTVDVPLAGNMCDV